MHELTFPLKKTVTEESKEDTFGGPRASNVSASQLQGYTANAMHQRPSDATQAAVRKAVESRPASTASVSQPKTKMQNAAPPQQSTLASTPTEQAKVSFHCDYPGCMNSRPFSSQKALNVHRADVHGLGGKPLDPTGKDSWILNQHARNQLKASGHLNRSSNGSHGSPRGGHGGGRGGRKQSPPRHMAPAPISTFGWTPPAPQAANGMFAVKTPVFTAGGRPPPPTASQFAAVPIATPTSQAAPSSVASSASNAVPPGPHDIEAQLAQINEIAPPMIRLNLQDDIRLCDDGIMVCGGINWKRMHIANQANVVADFEPQLPRNKILWEHYAQSPAAFKEENTARDYPVEDFMNSPDIQTPKTGLRVVALACIKVKVENNLQEVVKIAAVDVATCRILLNHLVCPDPATTNVTDWNFASTGMASFHDIEHARREGYKIFKGWQDARAALWKYIDKETILVGYNLRADLDALRMVHGCAFDVVKAVENAAKGPVPKRQLSLEVLCHSLSGVDLQSYSHPLFGRNALLNAFGIRELALWCVKRPLQLHQWAKRKRHDYQKVLGVSKPAASGGGLPTPAASPEKPDTTHASHGTKVTVG